VISDLLVEKLAEITALVPFSTGTPVKQQLTSGLPVFRPRTPSMSDLAI
jgi:hypothetical protein